jgi:hypothetical protein
VPRRWHNYCHGFKLINEDDRLALYVKRDLDEKGSINDNEK